MSINMEKGGNIVLSKDDKPLTKITVGLGWKPSAGNGEFDLDTSVVFVGGDGKADGNNTVYFNRKTSNCGSVVHAGDNRTGEGQGDDETILVDLSKVPDAFSKLVIVVNIYQASERNQNFGQVKDSYVRILDDQGVEFLKYDLQEDAGTDTALVFAEVYRHNGAWKFRALGETSKKNLSELVEAYV